MIYNTKVKIYPENHYNITFCNLPIYNLPKKAKPNVEPDFDHPGSIPTCEAVHLSCILDLDIKYVQAFMSACEYDENLKAKYNDAVKKYESKANTNSCKERYKLIKRKPRKVDKEANVKRAVKRAKDKVIDLALLNDFDYLVTLTIDPNKLDSLSSELVSKKLKSWLSNQKQRVGMEYVLIPEKHKSGRIHCHALIKNYPEELLKPAFKHSKGGELVRKANGEPVPLFTRYHQRIYNMPAWRLGWSTCEKIDKSRGSVKCARYLVKYITKDAKKLFGKYYYSSRGLKREPDIEYYYTNYDSVELKEYFVPNTRHRVKYFAGNENIALKYIKMQFPGFPGSDEEKKEPKTAHFNEDSCVGEQMPLEGFKWSIHGDKIIHNPHGVTNMDWT